MKIKYLTFLAIIASLFLIMNNCKKEEPYPCINLSPTNADFIHEYVFNRFGRITCFEEDTFEKESTIKFSIIDDEVDSCLWKVGSSQDTFTKKSFYLTFDEAYGDIEIRLIAYKKPNIACFPEDDGIDTVYKTIYLTEKEEIPYLGKFLGYNTINPNKPFIIEFKSGVDSDFTIPSIYYFISNLPEGRFPVYHPWGEFFHAVAMKPSWTNFYVWESDGLSTEGWGHYNQENEIIRIEYTHRDSNNWQNWLNLTFVGNKID